MASYRTDDFIGSLESKGFVRDTTHHNMFWYYYEGRRTSVRTRTSHGEREFDDALFHQRRKQMGGLSRKQMNDFIDCPLSAADYAKHLIGGGLVEPAD